MPTTCLIIFFTHTFLKVEHKKVKISLSLFLLVGHSGYTACSIPYILLKLEEIKGVRHFLCENILFKLFSHGSTLTPFHFKNQSYPLQRRIFNYFVNIGGTESTVRHRGAFCCFALRRSFPYGS